MNLHEQARAEAEKRWVTDGFFVNDPLGVEFARRAGLQRAYMDGFLAGHEAATRTRVVTSVTGLDALPVGNVVLAADDLAWQQDTTGWWTMAGSSRSRHSVHVPLPARVLYDPEEGR